MLRSVCALFRAKPTTLLCAVAISSVITVP